VEYLLFIVASAEYLGHHVQFVFVVVSLDVLRQRCSDVEFHILIKLQVCCVSGLELLLVQIFFDKDIVRLHPQDEARALLCHPQLGRSTSCGVL
jgi:hypothetical protein